MTELLLSVEAVHIFLELGVSKKDLSFLPFSLLALVSRLLVKIKNQLERLSSDESFKHKFAKVALLPRCELGANQFAHVLTTPSLD